MNRTALLYLTTELGPILVFFVVGRLTDFFTAVAIFMGATALACLLSWRLEKHIPVIPIISALFVFVGGGVTLLYSAPDAIILADTVYYLCIAVVLGVSLSYRTQLLKRLFNAVFAITDHGWRILTWRWFVALIIAAVANEYVRHFASPDFWIDYRFYKTIAITLFASYQFTLSRRYRIPEQSNAWGIRQRVVSKQ